MVSTNSYTLIREFWLLGLLSYRTTQLYLTTMAHQCLLRCPLEVLRSSFWQDLFSADASWHLTGGGETQNTVPSTPILRKEQMSIILSSHFYAKA